MNAIDTMELTILEDGTITVKTSAISDANHVNADALVKELEQMMGGEMTFAPNKEALAKAGAHAHTHGHATVGGHSHDGGKSFHNH